VTTTAPEAHEAPTLQIRLGDPRLLTEMLFTTEAIAHGHFELLGKDHSDTFIRFSRIAKRTDALDTTAGWLLPSVAAWMPDAVLAPATAGVALGWTLAGKLGVPVVLADVGDDGRAIPLRDPDAIAGMRVLLVNDIVTTGTGLLALANVARSAGATVAGATWFLARSDVDVGVLIGSPVSSVGELALPRWARKDCPLCRHGAELTPAIEVN
jgi:orotate phosphoribosyltransferase